MGEREQKRGAREKEKGIDTKDRLTGRSESGRNMCVCVRERESEED